MRLSYDPSKVKKNHLFILIDGVRINKGNDNELSDDQFFALENTKIFQDLEKKEAIKIIGKRPKKPKEVESKSEPKPQETEVKANNEQLVIGDEAQPSKAKK